MVAAVATFIRIDWSREEHLFLNYVTVLVTLTALGALEVGVLATLFLRERRLSWRLRRDLEQADRRAEYHARQENIFRQQVDQDAAMRKVYLASKLKEALGVALQPVRDLTQADEVSLFLLDARKQLYPEALVDDTGTYVGETVSQRNPDDEGVSACFQHQPVLQMAEGEHLRLLVKLQDEEVGLGVLAVTVRFEGDPDHQARQAEDALRFLKEIAPHVVSVIRTTHMRSRALYDPLTGLYNRGQLNRDLEHRVALAGRRGRDLSLVMLDIDHFKQVNDKHGHQAGDDVLTRVGGILRESLRDYDTAYRYGGEELALIVEDGTEADALTLVERVRKHVKREPFRGANGTTFYITLSAGVAQFDRATMSAPKDLVTKADAALYQAKQTGRDRVVLASSLTKQPTGTKDAKKRRKPRRRKKVQEKRS